MLFCFLSTADAQEQLFWYLEGTKAGFKDGKGDVVIKPTFVFADKFSEGLAGAGKGEDMFSALYGFINTKGDWVIQPQFNAVGQFTDGLARVSKDGNWGYIDKNGKIAITPIYDLCYEFENGYAQAQKKGKWGIINKKGEWIIAPTYYDLTNVSKDKILATKKDLYTTPWEIMDLKEKKLSDSTFDRVKDFNEGLAPARDKNDKYGFINSKGQWIIQPQFTNAEPFAEGLAAVEIDYGNWGFIDASGKVVIEPKYDRSASFINGFAFVERIGKHMYINKEGEIVLALD